MDINNNQQVNTFIGGMNTDTSDFMMKPEQYRYAENLRVSTNSEYNTGELRLVDGTYDITPSGQPWSKIVAMTSVRDLLIVIGTSTKGRLKINTDSEDKQDVVFNIFVCNLGDNTAYGDKGVFYQKLSSWLPYETESMSIVSKWENDKSAKLFIADGKNPIMTVNIANKDMTVVETISDITLQDNDFLMPLTISVQEGGNLRPCKVQYTYVLYKENTAPTSLAMFTELIPLFESENKGYDRGETTHAAKSIRIDLSTIKALYGTKYSGIKIYRITYLNSAQNAEYYMIHDTPNSIPDEVIDDSYDGTGKEKISYADLVGLITGGIIPKELESKDEYLFAANVHSTRDDADRDFKDLIGGKCRCPRYGDKNKDSIVDWDSYEWKESDWVNPQNGKIEGVGEFIRWELIQEPIYVHDDNKITSVSNPGQEADNKSLMRGEVYRYGIVLYDNKGRSTSPFWVEDIMVPPMGYHNTSFGRIIEDPNAIQSDKIKMNRIGVRFEQTAPFPSINLGTANEIKIVGWEIVRCNRTARDKITIAQGLSGLPMESFVAMQDENGNFNKKTQLPWFMLGEPYRNNDVNPDNWVYNRSKYWDDTNYDRNKINGYVSYDTLTKNTSKNLYPTGFLSMQSMVSNFAVCNWYQDNGQGDGGEQWIREGSNIQKSNDTYAIFVSPEQCYLKSTYQTEVEQFAGNAKLEQQILYSIPTTFYAGNTDDFPRVLYIGNETDGSTPVHKDYKRQYLKFTYDLQYPNYTNKKRTEILYPSLQYVYNQKKGLVDGKFPFDSENAYNLIQYMPVVESSNEVQSGNVPMSFFYIKPSGILEYSAETETTSSARTRSISDYNNVEDSSDDQLRDYAFEEHLGPNSYGSHTVNGNRIEGSGTKLSNRSTNVNQIVCINDGPEYNKFSDKDGLLYINNIDKDAINVLNNGYNFINWTAASINPGNYGTAEEDIKKLFEHDDTDGSLYVKASIGAGGPCTILTAETDHGFGSYSCWGENARELAMPISVANLKKRTVNPYGGHSLRSFNNSTLFGHGNIVTIDSNNPSATVMDVYDGDIFLGMFTYNASRMWQGDPYGKSARLATIYNVPIESSINLRATFGNLYPRENLNYPQCAMMQDLASNIMSGQVNYVQEYNAYDYNNAYSSEVSIKAYHPMYYSDFQASFYDNRIFWSKEEHTNGGQSTTWPTFGENDYIDVDSRFGQITNLTLFKDTLLFWQERAVGKLSVKEKFIVQQQGGEESDASGLIVGQGDVLKRYDYITTIYGMKENQHCFAKSDSALYWWDEDNKEMLQYSPLSRSSGGGLKPLSKLLNVENYINEGSAVTNPCVAFDNDYSEVIFKVRNNEAIVYNERFNVFTSVYTYNPIFYTDVAGSLYLSDIGHVYRSNDNKSSISWMFHNPAYPKLQYVVNKDSWNTKTFDIQTFGGRLYGGDDLNKLKFVYNTPLKQRGELKGTKLSNTVEFDTTYRGVSNREYDFRLNVPRAGKYDSNGKWVTEEYGDRLRGKTMQCELSSTSNSTDFSLQYIITKYRTSWS